MYSDPDAERSQTGAYSKRQTLFFTAITRFAIKNSLGEIERYYANKVRQAPHVISCYTAGARLIGLNDHQLEQEIRRMRKASKNAKSPYAKPLPFVTPSKRKPKGKDSHKKTGKSQKKTPADTVTVTITPAGGTRSQRFSIKSNGTDTEEITGTEIVALYKSCETGSQRRAAITPEDLEILVSPIHSVVDIDEELDTRKFLEICNHMYLLSLQHCS